MPNLFLYLAGRNKRGIKVITMLQGPPTILARVNDLTPLKLPQIWNTQIRKIIEDNRMLYEPWIESAASYNDLKTRLESRGYSHLAMGAVPMLNFRGPPPQADTSSCQIQTTMTKRRWL